MNPTGIKKELEEISPWPWKVFGVDNHIIGNNLEEAQENKTGHCQWTHNLPDENVSFVAKAPERIAELIKCVEDAREMAKKVLGDFSGYDRWGDNVFEVGTKEVLREFLDKWGEKPDS